MTRRNDLQIALASAISLPPGGEVPEWIHLLPAAAGGITTHDGRGPYTVADAQAVIRASLAQERGMPIDENHATDLAAPKGGPAPARGWIVDLEARADGIWGRVEWTETGKALLSERAYRGISPVFFHDKGLRVIAIGRASLTNTPNLRGLTPVIHQERNMDMARLLEALGLGADAGEDAVLGAIGKLKEGPAIAPALQSSITALGAAFGVTGAPEAILAGVQAKATAQPTEIVALQQQLSTVTTELNTLREEGKREKAEAFIDGAIRAGRVGVKPSRDRFVSMHMADPAGTEEIIAGLAILGPSRTTDLPPQGDGGVLTALNSEQIAIADQLGIPHDKYLASLNADRQEAR